MESYFLFTVFYLLMVSGFIFPPTEFVSVGLTIESIFARWLKSEEDQFIQYHVRRMVVTLFMHSLLPLGYLFGLKHILPPTISIWEGNILWRVYVSTSIVVPMIAAYIVMCWNRDHWRSHPVAKALMNFTTNEASLNGITRDINNEYRGVDKVIVKCNAFTKVVATDNWLIKVSPYRVDIAHQSDLSLVVSSTDTYQFVPDTPGGVQYLNIDIKTSRPNVPPFKIRITSTDLKDLQDKIIRPIQVLDNVVVHKTLTDRFLETFKENIQQNPSVNKPDNLDVCIGCMQATPAVKLQTCCSDTSGSNGCTMCYCRPMWCIECMGKWFASRQDQDQPNTWLSSKCTCPMCRSRFCILDVCPLAEND